MLEVRPRRRTAMTHPPGAWCQPHNQRLERTVLRHRGDAASAPLHYALASRFTPRRAVAQPRRYAAEGHRL